MNSLKKISLPLWLAIAAAIVSFNGLLLVFSSIPSIQISVLGPEFIVPTIITGTLTFLVSHISLRILKTKKLSQGKSAVIGFALGLATLVGASAVVAIIGTLLSDPSLGSLWRSLQTITRLAFIHGGFLGPIVGALTAYWACRNNSVTSVFD